MDLTGLSELELFDLQQKIREELKERPTRDKTLVYKLFVPFLVNEHYLKIENAIKALKEYIDDYEYVHDFKKEEDYIQLGISFVDKSGLQFCKDFE